MRYAIMSDVHANPQALERALEDARALGCTDFIMLGDTTGYGYDAAKSMELVRANFNCVLLGNHDSVCVGRDTGPEVTMNPNYDLDRAQAKDLTADDLSWLAERPFVYRHGDAAFVHGELTRPQAWRYMMDENAARANFGLLDSDERVVFCGHTHHAAAWSLSPKGRIYEKYAKRLMVPATRPESMSFRLKEGWRYVVNAGSVGYPRADFCSVYVIYDTIKHQVTYRRLPFDFNFYVRSMVSRGLELPWWLLELIQRVSKKVRLVRPSDAQ